MSPIPPNHSLSLIKLFKFSCPEGDKLLDCSVGLSPFSPSITNNVNVNIATSLHQRLPVSGRVHHLSCPDTLCLTQTTFKITEYIHKLVHIPVRIRSHISIYLNICIYIHVVTDTDNIRHGIVRAQTSHNTCTCTATLSVIEL